MFVLRFTVLRNWDFYKGELFAAAFAFFFWWRVLIYDVLRVLTSVVAICLRDALTMLVMGNCLSQVISISNHLQLGIRP